MRNQLTKSTVLTEEPRFPQVFLIEGSGLPNSCPPMVFQVFLNEDHSEIYVPMRNTSRSFHIIGEWQRGLGTWDVVKVSGWPNMVLSDDSCTIICVLLYWQPTVITKETKKQRKTAIIANIERILS